MACRKWWHGCRPSQLPLLGHQLVAGHLRPGATIHTHIHTSGQFGVTGSPVHPQSRVFRVWEEAGLHGETPRRHAEDVHTLHRNAPGNFLLHRSYPHYLTPFWYGIFQIESIKSHYSSFSHKLVGFFPLHISREELPRFPSTRMFLCVLQVISAGTFVHSPESFKTRNVNTFPNVVVITTGSPVVSAAPPFMPLVQVTLKRKTHLPSFTRPTPLCHFVYFEGWLIFSTNAKS